MFSIVTANWNGEKVLENFLASLSKQSFQDFKLYLVDNGSHDNSKQIIGKYMNSINIELISLTENKGFAIANNIGITKAIEDDSTHIITLNNDLELKKNCLEICHKTVSSKGGEFQAFQLLLINYYDRDLIDAAGIKFDRMYGIHQIGHKKKLDTLNDISEINIDGACAGAAIYSKYALKKVMSSSGDFFDPVYFAYYEDADLAIRLSQSKFKTLLIKEALVYHVHSATSGRNSYFKSFLLSRNALIFLYKNAPINDYKKKSKRFYVKIYINALKNIIRLNFKAAKGCIDGALEFNKMRSKGIL